MHVEVNDGHALHAEVFQRMERAHGQVVEHAVARTKVPVSVVGPAGHVARKTTVANGVFGCLHRTTD